ncbi:MAG: ABC transporter ATP-binding protein [Lachnospiraceae bacterium]|nr:ABC transporter ATP-binding protein [Lachnospiraceae bacterium]
MSDIVCSLQDFSLQFREDGTWYPAVSDLNLEIHAGEMVALIGESGCGKSVTALSLMGLWPEEARVSGSLVMQGENLLAMDSRRWAEYRGSQVSMIFQEPMTALNPLIKVGKQIRENVLVHQHVTRREAKQQVLGMMKQAGLPDVEALYHCYPHQLSGGQRQRIMIAMAMINHPSLLIADEPTTALDVTIQAQIMELMRQMNRELGSAVLLISHDLGVVKNLCSRAYIMYAGHVVESGPVAELLQNPMHPYTRGLVAAIPGPHCRDQELASIPGTVPALNARLQIGCGFCNRCAWKTDICEKETPQLKTVGNRMVRCHRVSEQEHGKRSADKGEGLEGEGQNSAANVSDAEIERRCVHV